MIASLVNLDVRLFEIINQANSPMLDHFFSVVTYLGHEIAIVVALFVIIYLKVSPENRRKILVFTAAGLLLCGIVNQATKRVIKRDRPIGYYYKQAEARGITNSDNADVISFINRAGYPIHVPGKKLRSGSFPSGHTATAFAAATVLMSIFSIKLWYLLVIAVLVAYSRVYLGVHFPLDVLAGGIVGVTTTLPFMMMCRQKQPAMRVD